MTTDLSHLKLSFEDGARVISPSTTISTIDDFPDLKLKTLVCFPAVVRDGIGIDAVKSNGVYQFDLAFDDFAPPVAGVSDAAHQNLLLWNSVTEVYTLTPVSLLGGGGGVPEAPNDGRLYARQSLAWTAIPKITVSSTAPPSPAVNDVWIDTT